MQRAEIRFVFGGPVPNANCRKSAEPSRRELAPPRMAGSALPPFVSCQQPITKIRGIFGTARRGGSIYAGRNLPSILAPIPFAAASCSSTF